MEDDLACELFLEADKLLNGSIYLQKAINKSPEYREYCPNNKQCSTRAESIGALSVYLFTNFYNKESGYYEHFIMWLAHTLFKIAKKRNNENAHNITLSSAYDKYLDKSMGHLRQWDILNDVRGGKDPNLKHMSELYTLLNHICNTIADYKKYGATSRKLHKNSVNCLNQYRNLYRAFSGNASYLSLLEKLKKIYDDFRTAAIKNDIGKKNNIESRLLELTAIKKKESHSTKNFKTLDSNGPEDQLEDEKDPEIPKEKSTQEERTYHKNEGKNTEQSIKLQNTVVQTSNQRDKPSVSEGESKISGNEQEHSEKSQGLSIDPTKENLLLKTKDQTLQQELHPIQPKLQLESHNKENETLQKALSEIKPQSPPEAAAATTTTTPSPSTATTTPIIPSTEVSSQHPHHQQPKPPQVQINQVIHEPIQPQHTMKNGIDSYFILNPDESNPNGSKDQLKHEKKPEIPKENSIQEVEKYPKTNENDNEQNINLQNSVDQTSIQTKESSVSGSALKFSEKDTENNGKSQESSIEESQKENLIPKDQEQPPIKSQSDPQAESQDKEHVTQPASTQEKSLTSYETIKKITENGFLYDFYKLQISSFYKNLTDYGNRLYESASTSLTKGYSAFNNFANDLITQPNKINVTSQSVDNSIQPKGSGSDIPPSDNPPEKPSSSPTEFIDKKTKDERHEKKHEGEKQENKSEGQDQVSEAESKGQISETEGGTQEENPEDGIHETNPEDESHETNFEGENQEKEPEYKGKISENEEPIQISTPKESSEVFINITSNQEIGQLPSEIKVQRDISEIKVQNGIFGKGFPVNLFKESKLILYSFIVIAILVMLAVMYKCLGFGRRKKEKKKKKMKKVRKLCDENNTEKNQCNNYKLR
ncbi:hypothetical protein YYC_05582 [Plasmodium yoelii 17X]|uniref:YIR protein n=1 Tax=Plasmodium yoelii 17X TaxID=1323249 RepID=V7PCD6_PLAYE|nr:hypothetical protein YYC_05582 [Plasmodium yoelii 17X]